MTDESLSLSEYCVLVPKPCLKAPSFIPFTIFHLITDSIGILNSCVTL